MTALKFLGLEQAVVVPVVMVHAMGTGPCRQIEEWGGCAACSVRGIEQTYVTARGSQHLSAS